MLRLGLCCKFHQVPIAFRTTTATALLRMPRQAQLRKVSDLALENAEALKRALQWCVANTIGAFRINSQILPLKTHPDVGYAVADLPQADKVVAAYQNCGALARQAGIRLSFHPDQFILLSALNPAIVQASIKELIYQTEVSSWVHADVINIHAGGAYGDKAATCRRLIQVIETLSPEVRSRLTLENDDRLYTPSDLLPVCHETGLPLVYDVHHHRCLPDGVSVEEITQQALQTWHREPLFHISSPRDGYNAKTPGPHHDMTTPTDVPDCWHPLDLTLDVEAKAKEVAVMSLRHALQQQGVSLWKTTG